MKTLFILLFAATGWAATPAQELRFIQRHMEGTGRPVALLPQAVPQDEKLQKELEEVMKLLRQKSAQKPELKTLRDGAWEGTLQSLDAYSTLMAPEDHTRFKESMGAGFVGMGAIVEKKPGDWPTIKAPIPNSPAARAGIRRGDKILRIITSDGAVHDTLKMDLNAAVALIRGKAGTKVTLEILPAGANPRDPPKKVEITRAGVRKPYVFSEIAAPGIGYIFIEQFNENVDLEFNAALIELGEIRALIIDVRNNPGGYLSVCREMASHFLKRGDALITQSGKSGDQTLRIAQNGAYQKMPLAILINENSASASEILSGTLQDHKKAVLIGEPTYGKSWVQNTFDKNSDVPEPGYVTKITIAKYKLPNGRILSHNEDGKGGVEPDIQVAVSQKEQNQLVEERELKVLRVKPETQTKDAVLEKAVEELKKKLEKK